MTLHCRAAHEELETQYNDDSWRATKKNKNKRFHEELPKEKNKWAHEEVRKKCEAGCSSSSSKYVSPGCFLPPISGPDSSDRRIRSAGKACLACRVMISQESIYHKNHKNRYHKNPPVTLLEENHSPPARERPSGRTLTLSHAL